MPVKTGRSTSFMPCRIIDSLFPEFPAYSSGHSSLPIARAGNLLSMLIHSIGIELPTGPERRAGKSRRTPANSCMSAPNLMLIKSTAGEGVGRHGAPQRFRHEGFSPLGIPPGDPRLVDPE